MHKAIALLSAAFLGLVLAGGCGGNAVNAGGGDGGASLPAGRCRSDDDCPKNGQYYCDLQSSPCSTICAFQTPQCGQSSYPACAAGTYCNVCQECVSLCNSDADCYTGTACNPSTHQCGARACAADSQCPTNFACAQGACARKACTTDAECQGVCASGHCVSQLGTCIDCV